MLAEQVPEQSPQELVEGQEHPIETTEEIGEAAVEATTQIPITEAGGNPHPDRVQDVEKAHTMALAGNEDRTEAANKRSGAQVIEDFQLAEVPPEEQQYQEGPRQNYVSSYGERDPYNTRRFYEASQEHPGFSDLDDPGDRERGYDFSTRGLANEVVVAKHHGEIPRAVEYFKEKAKKVDERAERKEDWAGIMHEHPVSDSYKEAHPDVDFDPVSLIRLEDDSKWELEGADAFEKKGKELSGLYVTGGILTGENHSLESLMYDVATSQEELTKLQDRFDNLIKNPETTLGQLSDFYNEILQEAVIKPLRNKANVTKAMLEDIRSGQASESAHPETQTV